MSSESMFKHISMHLKGPICDCEYQDLAWSLSRANSRKIDHRYSLHIFCRACGGYIILSPEEFVATIELEKPYPKGGAPTKPKIVAPVIVKPKPDTKIPTSNVLPFPNIFKEEDDKGT